jgi:hypothetical protein
MFESVDGITGCWLRICISRRAALPPQPFPHARKRSNANLGNEVLIYARAHSVFVYEKPLLVLRNFLIGIL